MSQINCLSFGLAIFATYRIALVISRDQISANIRLRIGRKASGSAFWKFVADLITCPFCLGVWIAGLMVVLLIIPYGFWFVLLFGIAGVQHLIQKFSDAMLEDE